MNEMQDLKAFTDLRAKIKEIRDSDSPLDGDILYRPGVLELCQKWKSDDEARDWLYKGTITKIISTLECTKIAGIWLRNETIGDVEKAFYAAELDVKAEKLEKASVACGIRAAEVRAGITDIDGQFTADWAVPGEDETQKDAKQKFYDSLCEFKFVEKARERGLNLIHNERVDDEEGSFFKIDYTILNEKEKPTKIGIEIFSETYHALQLKADFKRFRKLMKKGRLLIPLDSRSVFSAWKGCVDDCIRIYRRWIPLFQ